MADLTLDTNGLIVPCAQCGQRNRRPFAPLDVETRCGKCRTPLPAPGAPADVPDVASFDAALAAGVPLVVDFWAPWCGPCLMMAPELDQVAVRSRGRYLVLKVNTDQVTGLGERFRIQSIPTMAVFEGGREVARTTGARPAAEIEAFVQSALGR